MQKLIRIKNLDCAACAAELQEELERIGGTENVSVDFVTQRVKFEYDTQKTLEQAIHTISHFEEVEIIDGNAPRKKERHLKEIISIAVALAFFIPALVLELVNAGSEWIPFG